MPYADIDGFHAKLKSSPDLFRQLFDGVNSAEDFIDRAVSEARAQGYNFDKQEVAAWIENIVVPDVSELSDDQLEAVAGGKGEAANNLRNFFNTTSKDFEKSLANLVSDMKHSNYEPPPWQ